MFVIRNNDSSILLMYKNIENAKKKLFEILKIHPNNTIKLTTKYVGYINDENGADKIYELSIKKKKSKSLEYSAFNNDPIMYNGPGGFFPDELRFMNVEDEDEDENESDEL